MIIKIEGRDMTRAQERAIEVLKERWLGFYGHPEMKEFKRELVEEWEDGTVYVSLEVGAIGDEGTMAAIICRNNLSLCIGKKGGYFKHSDSKSHYRKSFSNATYACIGGAWK